MCYYIVENKVMHSFTWHYELGNIGNKQLRTNKGRIEFRTWRINLILLQATADFE